MIQECLEKVSKMKMHLSNMLTQVIPYKIAINQEARLKSQMKGNDDRPLAVISYDRVMNYKQADKLQTRIQEDSVVRASTR